MVIYRTGAVKGRGGTVRRGVAHVQRREQRRRRRGRRQRLRLRGDGHADPALRRQVAGDDNDNDDDGDDDRIARDDRIDGGSQGPRAPRGQTSTAAALARRGFNVVAVAERSGAVRECADARTFERHRHADVRVFLRPRLRTEGRRR